jgi:hypothetical protein
LYAGLCGSGCCHSLSRDIGRNQLTVFEPRLFLVEWAIRFRQVLWRIWYVSILPAGMLGRKKWDFWSTAFLLEVVCQFKVTISFSEVVECLFSPDSGRSAWCSALSLLGRGEIFHLFGRRFWPGLCNLPTSYTGLCGSFQSSWCITLTWWSCNLTQFWDSKSR